MSKVPFMPLWVADFMAKTSDLDAKEAGAYLLILMTLWTRGGTLPDDQKKLQRVARVGRDWPKVWDAISHYFRFENGQISQDRLTEELHKANMKREVNAHAGARGGRAKALKTNEQALANANDPLKQSEPESEVRDTVANATVGAASAPPLVIPLEPKKSTGRVRGAARATQIPTGWAPCPASYAYGSKQGLTPQEINHEADQFRNHAAQNRRTLIDWHAGFRTWLGKAGQWKRERSARPAARTVASGQPRGGGMVAAGLRAIGEARGYGEQVPDPFQGRTGIDDMGTGYDLDGDALRIAGS
jgi:uncharacterized protein YdaU (DUF1376 family)